jgi:protoporphyrinogen oxidase
MVDFQRLHPCLSDKFQNQILLETKVKGIKKESNSYIISFNNREDIVCKNIISTIPAYSLKEIIFDNRIKKALSKVEYNPIDVFHFGFSKKDIKNEIDGFGLLTKPEDKKSFLGILFSSNIFSHVSGKDKFLMTVLVGGKRQKELCELPPKEIEK